MHQRYNDRNLYFEEQAYTTKHYVIPFIEEFLPIKRGVRILEIGCGEGGNLLPFLDMGCKVTGIDLAINKINNAKKFFKDHENFENLTLINSDIYDVTIEEKFDLIIMRDVLEHIHNQERFMNYVKKFLYKDALFFLGFPPWQNPYGGHQQICQNKLLSKLPYFHILPKPLYKMILKSFGEKGTKIEELLEIKDTQITIERFNKIIKAENFKVKKKQFYFINPNYEIKFKLKPRKQLNIISRTPYFRNFFITTCYYLISNGNIEDI